MAEYTTTTGPTVTTYGTTPVTGLEHKTSWHRAEPRVSWGGIVVGAFTTLAVGIMLMALGAAIGLTSFNPRDGFGEGGVWGTGIWSAVSIALSTFVGAMVGSKASSLFNKPASAIQGIAVWAVSFIAMLSFVSWMSSVTARTATGALAPIVGSAAEVVGSGAEAASGQELRQLGQQAQQALPEGEQARETATQVAGTAADVGAATMWWFFLSALLSLGAGLLGGIVGAPKELKGKHRHERETTTGYHGLTPRGEPV